MNMNSYSCCVHSTKEGNQIEELVATLKIVAEPNRLKLLCILRKGKHCVCEIMNHANLSQSLISHHLKDLRDIGMVSDEKRGLRVYYSLTSKGITITNTLFQIVGKGK